MSTDDKAFISGPITEPRLALTPQERAWVEELDEYGWSYGDIMLQRDEARDRAEKAEAAVDAVLAVLDQHWDWKAGRTLALAVRAAIDPEASESFGHQDIPKEEK